MTKRESRLGKVRKGILDNPKRILIVGPEGIGKTSLAVSAPKPIIFDLEDGSSNLEVDRYSFREAPDGHVPTSLTEIREGVHDLLDSPHEYETLIIDTIDRLEALLWDHMLKRDSDKQSAINKNGRTLTNIEHYGYGKGFNLAVDEWRSLCNLLDILRLKRQMAIILVGHVSIKTFKDPEGEDYDRYFLRIHEKGAGRIQEWVDIHGFCTFEEGGGKLDPDQPRAKGWSTGRRLLKLRRAAAYDAKTRIALPNELEMSLEDPWGPFAIALKKARTATPESLIKEIEKECKRLGNSDLTKWMRSAVKRKKGDTNALSRWVAELRDREIEKKEEVKND